MRELLKKRPIKTINFCVSFIIIICCCCCCCWYQWVESMLLYTLFGCCVCVLTHTKCLFDHWFSLKLSCKRQCVKRYDSRNSDCIAKEKKRNRNCTKAIIKKSREYCNIVWFIVCNCGFYMNGVDVEWCAFSTRWFRISFGLIAMPK